MDGSGDAVFYASFISGLLAGAAASFTVTPLDGSSLHNIVRRFHFAVIKTRMQFIGRHGSEAPYRNVPDAFM